MAAKERADDVAASMWSLHKDAKELHRDARNRSERRDAPENKSEVALTMIAVAMTALCGLYAGELEHAQKPRR